MWVSENREWADAPLLVEYAELDEAAKQKNREIVRIAVSVWFDEQKRGGGGALRQEYT